MTNIPKFGTVTNPIERYYYYPREITTPKIIVQPQNILPPNSIFEPTLAAAQVASSFAPAGPVGAVVGATTDGLARGYEQYKQTPNDKGKIVVSALGGALEGGALGAIGGGFLKQIKNAKTVNNLVKGVKNGIR